MKWRDFYAYAIFLDVESVGGLVEFIRHMATMQSFPVKFVPKKIRDLKGQEFSEAFKEAPTADVRFHSLTALMGTEVLVEAVIEICVSAPRGFRHGTFTIRLNSNATCFELPDEMFDDSDVPDYLLTS